ncbi:MAG: hypothetical protein ACOY16_06305 [Chloroflexota bacterium]
MTKRKTSTLLAIILAFGNILLIRQISLAQISTQTLQMGQAAPTPPVFTPPYPHVSDEGQSPDISFINSPSPSCVNPNPGTGICYIRWPQISVSAGSSQYIISMTVSLDNHIQAYVSGFFQTAMNIPGNLLGSGFKVTCGFPGSSGSPLYGKSYTYNIVARETGGLTAQSNGIIQCPADIVKINLPIIKR